MQAIIFPCSDFSNRFHAFLSLLSPFRSADIMNSMQTNQQSHPQSIPNRNRPNRSTHGPHDKGNCIGLWAKRLSLESKPEMIYFAQIISRRFEFESANLWSVIDHWPRVRRIITFRWPLRCRRSRLDTRKVHRIRWPAHCKPSLHRIQPNRATSDHSIITIITVTCPATAIRTTSSNTLEEFIRDRRTLIRTLAIKAFIRRTLTTIITTTKWFGPADTLISFPDEATACQNRSASRGWKARGIPLFLSVRIVL